MSVALSAPVAETPAAAPPAPALAGTPAADVTLPLRFFALGLAGLAVFAVMLPFFAGEVLGQYHYNHRAVAFTHLLVLGWLAPVLMGATFQVIPVVTGKHLHGKRLARWAFILYAAGIAGMIPAYWIWSFRLLIWFAIPLTAAFVLFIYNVARTLKSAGRWDLFSVHVATALVYLALTFLAGQYLIHDKLHAFSPFSVIAAIHAHAHLAALGWFAMMVIGVSYRLMPMFALTTLQSRARAWTCYGLLNAGILGVFAGLILHARWLPAAALAVSAALILWVIELAAMLRRRKKRVTDVSLLHALVAALHVPVLAAAGLWLSWPGKEPTWIESQAQTSYGLIALLGWLTFFSIAMLHKIIPFLVWFRVYAPRIGLMEVPKLQELFSTGFQHAAGYAFLAGLWITSALACVGWMVPPWTLQAASALMGAGLLIFILNLAAPMVRYLRATHENWK